MKPGDIVSLKSGGPKMTVVCLKAPQVHQAAYQSLAGMYGGAPMAPAYERPVRCAWFVVKQ